MNTETLTRACEQHGPYEAQTLTIGAKRMVIGVCPACANAREIERAARERADRQNAIRANYLNLVRRAQFPPRLQTATIDAYRTDLEGQAKAKARAEWFVQDWEKLRQLGTGMIFTGSAGTGKSHLAAAIGMAIVRKGDVVRYATVADAMREIREAYGDEAKYSERQAIDRFVEPQLLILDEIGSGSGSDHEKSMLFDIVDKRYQQLRNTILVTNMAPDVLTEHVGNRVMDRMREGSGKLVTFNWPSYRK